MAYTSNPQLPRLRMQAVLLVRKGWTARQVARHMGYSHSTIVRWCQKAPFDGRETIPTLSSRPHGHPDALAPEIVSAIIQERLHTKRCAQVIHAELVSQGIVVSLSSVKRTLAREELTKPKSKWKRYRPPVPRPPAVAPGALLQMDTVHFARRDLSRFYVYTLVDVHSRWAYAEYHTSLSQRISFEVVQRAQQQAPFTFQMLQTDNGPEFGRWYADALKAKDIGLRHSRVRTPNDNAHIERFNRTIQDECLGRWPEENLCQEQLEVYLPYYNYQRRHIGLDMARPVEVVQRY